MTTLTLPPVTPAFARAVRELAHQVGWRNVARRIAYGPVKDESVAEFPTTHDRRWPRPKNGYSRTRNQFGHKDNYGLPGPNPPRNKAGGFKCAAPGGYEREWGDLIGTGTFRRYSEGKRKPGAKPISITLMQDKEEELRQKRADGHTTAVRKERTRCK